MIPEEPKDFDERSHEDVVFNAFKNNYRGDEEYYVFHSYNAVSYNPRSNILDDRDLDFVIVNEKRGVLCIEVKAGSGIYFSSEDRKWHYSNGEIMHRGGPYKQIAGAKRALRDKVEYHSNRRVCDLMLKCRFLDAVCFVDMQRRTFQNAMGLPEEVNINTTIFHDDLERIWDRIERIYNIRLPIEEHNPSLSQGMSASEMKLLMDSVFCPEFHLIPSPETRNDTIRYRQKQLIREQFKLLEFLEEQPSAVINGSAGTGKTMIATEKARRHSMDGDKVLFLCYNKKLQKHLEDGCKENSEFENVKFMTLSKLAKDKTGNFQDYAGLERWLDRCIRKEVELGYKHIIIDEGQDFGVIDVHAHPEKEDEAYQNCGIINKLQEAALESGGTFYLFYDKYQTIQGGQSVEIILPDCIDDADCRLSLHKNCRNTKEIAKTSATPIKDSRGRNLRVETAYSWVKPYTPTMHVIRSREKELEVLNKLIDECWETGLTDIVILTQGQLDYTSIYNSLIRGTGDDPYDYYRYKDKKIRVATCITFKGLEADAIILMNLNKDSFIGERGKEFYVGSSRAKCKLDMICTINDSDFVNIVSQIDEGAPRNRNANAMKRIFEALFSLKIQVES